MSFIFGGLFEEVYSIIKRWKPKKRTREKEYRDDLINFLRKELNKQDLLWFQKTHLIQKETGRHLADIGIDKSVGIELKLNLSKLSEADRLIQQVRRFLEEYEEGVIVVLCGRSDREKVDYVKHVFKNMNEIGKRVEIITKRHTKQKKRKEEFPFEINLFR